MVQKHHLDATKILDQMQVFIFQFVWFFKGKHDSSLTVVLDIFFYLAHLFLRKTRTNLKHQCIPCVLPPHYFPYLSLFLTEKQAFVMHSLNCRSYH